MLVALQEEGKIRHIGLSEVSVEELRTAQGLAPIVSVQNRYNLADRAAEAVLAVCTAQGLGFIPWFPLDALAREYGVAPTQLALAWLLRRSPMMLPIPGTASVAHLEENVAAAGLYLTDAQVAALARRSEGG